MIHLPDKVKVGGQVYDVQQKDIITMDGRSSLVGKIMYTKNTIEILADQLDARKLETYLHELTHAMLYEAGYGDHEEELVERFSKILHQVVTDNRWHIGVEEVAN